VKLTGRQLEVAKLVAEGRGDKEIATLLSIAETTVHHHVAQVMRRTGTTKRVSAVVKLLKAGELDLASLSVEVA
jgi:DNA-binding NarL/FixJ family response regulator